MSKLYILLSIAVLFCLERIYFKIANHYNIIDKPNHRSSHSNVTIRGGGVIFSLAALLFFLVFGFQYPYFIVGLLLISVISFIDDVVTLNNKIRLGVHLIAVGLLFFQWGLFGLAWYWIPVAAIFVIGTINAYNFMDGINGITGGYSFAAIASLFYINEEIVAFTSSELLIIVGLSLLVFNFFNFRKRAKCFAGDVGSVSIAFILVFFIGQLILATGNFSYILLLLVYGLDAVFTIGFRVLRKENIFEAHRSHFYQYLANQKKWSHLVISLLYVVLQLFANAVLLFVAKDSALIAISLTVFSAICFLLVRFYVEGKGVLLKNKADF
ncbi:UDP-N-acetylmuramyl pentapeptide phosphotransferase/UDP-N-acetylglucosamine-1-phosphate transferase [Pedobacter sp. UYP30]|uniref:MraY family glycosyltransferase n=1 Tax=Pedobacter sp. UYP30 TaxID=1756400 RepID=UPI0033920409